MSAPASVPTIKQIPNDDAYGVDILKLLREYDRGGYKDAFGIDPPSYDLSRPTKGWFDSSADVTKDYSYQSYVSQGPMAAPLLTTIVIPGSVAAEPNIYGLHSYPAYTFAPSGVMTTDPTGLTVSPVQTVYLSTKEQAVTLASQLGLNSDSVIDGTLSGGLFKTVYPPGEERRIWLINFKGTQISAGLLLQEENANGVGAPGHWDLSGAEPNWISGIPSSLPPANPIQPVPMRPLNDNEEFVVSLMGVDIVKKTAPAVLPPSGGSGLTVEQDGALRSILSGVNKILSFFRIP